VIQDQWVFDRHAGDAANRQTSFGKLEEMAGRKAADLAIDAVIGILIGRTQEKIGEELFIQITENEGRGYYSLQSTANHKDSIAM